MILYFEEARTENASELVQNLKVLNETSSFELQWKADLYLQSLAIKTFFFLQKNIPRQIATKAANRNKQNLQKRRTGVYNSGKMAARGRKNFYAIWASRNNDPKQSKKISQTKIKTTVKQWFSHIKRGD